jgi:hypothetical protein
MRDDSMRFGVFLATMALLSTMLTPSVLAANSEFDALVSGIERRYQVHHEHIPLLGVVSFCAWVYTRGGVKGFRVADFEDAGGRISGGDIDSFVQEKLGTSWNVILRSHERKSRNDTIIYARSAGDKFLMLIAEVDNDELSLVRVSVNANRLSKWINDQERHDQARHDQRHGREKADLEPRASR